MAFKLSLVADVRSWLKGTADVERSLDDLADGLDDLARDTKAGADQAADTLTREFSDAFDKVKTESKTAGRRIGDDIGDGARRAGDGLDEFKDEANSTAREAAASFDGSFDSVADGIQEVLANALAGFGPAGAAAGLAAAAGLGILLSQLEASAEAAHEAQEKVNQLASELNEVDGNAELLDWAEKVRDTLQQVIDKKEGWQVWKAGDSTVAEQVLKAAQDYNLTIAEQATLVRALAGDQRANADALAILNRETEAQKRTTTEVKDEYGNTTQIVEGNTSALDDMARKIRETTDVQREAEAQTRLANAAISDGDAIKKRAAEASADFSSNLTDHLSVADEGLGEFVKAANEKWSDFRKRTKEATTAGTLDVGAWATEVQRRLKEVQSVESFTVDIAPRLSPEAMARFAELPTETQAQIARAYKSSGKGTRQKIVQTLEAEAKVTKVNIDTSAAQKQASSKPIEVPTTVVDTGAVKGAQDAADAAQKVAHRDNNRIEYRTRLDRDDLQRQVNRAAASITPPTITIRTKVAKEVP